MLRMFARWFISRSIDGDCRLPDWLRCWIDRDDQLRQFELLSRQLGDRLKLDAPSWIASRALPSHDSSSDRRNFPLQSKSIRRKRRIAWSLAWGALAGCTLFAFARWQLNGDHAERPSQLQGHHAVQTSASETLSAADRERLVAVWRIGRVNFGQLQAQAKHLPRRAEVLRLPGVSAFVEPAEVAGSTAGRALATLDRGMKSEQQQLTIDIRTSFSFFAYRVPASMGKLVGWQPCAPSAPNGRGTR